VGKLRVMMVAEKPSIAKDIFKALSGKPLQPQKG